MALTKGVPFPLIPPSTSLPSAPPSYYLPDPVQQPNGEPIPANCSNWLLQIDVANVPSTQQIAFRVEYIISGVWTDDAGGSWWGGSYTKKGGGTSSIAGVSSSIGQSGQPYPTGARVHVTQNSDTWTFPSITLTLT